MPRSPRRRAARLVRRPPSTSPARRVERIARGLEQSVTAISGMPLQRQRIRTMAEILGRIATTAGEVDEQALVLVGRLGIASFVFDDRVDDVDPETALEIRDLRFHADQLSACAAGRYVPEVAYDPLARFVAEAAADLASAPAAEAAWADWSLAAHRMFDGIVEHRALGDRLQANEPLSLAEILRVGSRSIGTEVFCVAAWITMGTPELLEHRATLWRITRCLARATRIANDLRTADKDAAEGGVNVLGAEGASVAKLLDKMHADLDAAQALTETVPSHVRGAVRFTVELARHIVGVYALRDFHQVAVQTDGERVAGSPG